MIELELSCEAFEEVRDKCIAAGIIEDVPVDWCEDHADFTVGGITFKEWKYVPTAEDIARREEYRKTPLGQLMEKTINKQVADMINGFRKGNWLSEYLGNNHLLGKIDTKDLKVGTTLRIRLPSDYTVKD